MFTQPLVQTQKHESYASLAFVRGIQQWPANSPHKGPVTRKMFPFDDVIMMSRSARQCSISYWYTIEAFISYPYIHPGCHCNTTQILFILRNRRFPSDDQTTSCCAFIMFYSIRTHISALLMLRLQQSGRLRSMPWLLMLWPLSSPGHQQPWYWINRIAGSNNQDAISINERKSGA